MALEQKYLNVTTRKEGYIDIMMYVPDSTITISNVSCDDVLSYSDLSSIIDLKKYSSSTIATLEENLWLLDGSLVNPTSGRTYNGYISNSISDDDGDFINNPIINVSLQASSHIEYFSLILNPAVKSSYPKQIKITTNNSNVYTSTIANETTLPNVIFQLTEDNVTSLSIEFVGTQRGGRRIRLANIMFGRVITLDQDKVMETEYYDKNSYVCDSIPSRTFTFRVNNYNKEYNIDNPNNSIIDLTQDTKVMIRNGYNIFGYDDTIHEYDLTEFGTDIAWDDWKELRLLEVITNDDDTVSFNCGSILDMMTDTYTKEIFENNRRVDFIVNQLLNFMGLDTSLVTFSVGDGGLDYGAYLINTPLPQLPVRELLQLLAFSIGATLLIKDNGTIKFANINIDVPNSFTNTHEFEYKDFLSIPVAENLECTNKVSLPKYNAYEGSQEEVIQSFDITAYDTQITYSACKGAYAEKDPNDTSGGSIQDSLLYCETGQITASLPTTDPMKINIKGKRLTIKQTQDRTITNDTLIIDTKLMKEDPGNLIKTKYANWYSKPFKYKMQTRGEPLVDAGDYCIIQTPFSTQLPSYVLQNHIVFNGAWSGDMEVIAL